jgi:peroxiredoxin
VAQLRLKLSQIEQASVRLVLVGMGTPEESAVFAEKSGLPFPVISDPGRRLYQAFGLKMASALELLSPSVAFKAFAAMVQGHGVGMPVGDIRQLSGVFIIDTAGRIVFSHIAKDPADHPDADTILAALSWPGPLQKTNRG